MFKMSLHIQVPNNKSRAWTTTVPALSQLKISHPSITASTEDHRSRLTVLPGSSARTSTTSSRIIIHSSWLRKAKTLIDFNRILYSIFTSLYALHEFQFRRIQFVKGNMCANNLRFNKLSDGKFSVYLFAIRSICSNIWLHSYSPRGFGRRGSVDRVFAIVIKRHRRHSCNTCNRKFWNLGWKTVFCDKVTIT